MKSDIRVCSEWKSVHERSVYTLGDTCPDCGSEAVNSAPAPFNPEDPYGEYRRRARRRREGATDRNADENRLPANTGPTDNTRPHPGSADDSKMNYQPTLKSYEPTIQTSMPNFERLSVAETGKCREIEAGFDTTRNGSQGVT